MADNPHDEIQRDLEAARRRLNGALDDARQLDDAFHQFDEARRRDLDATRRMLDDARRRALEQLPVDEEIVRQQTRETIERGRLDAECRSALDERGLTPLVREAVFYFFRDLNDEWWIEGAAIHLAAAAIEQDAAAMELVYGTPWRELSIICDSVATLPDEAIHTWREISEHHEVSESILQHTWDYLDSTPDDPRDGQIDRASQALMCATARRFTGEPDLDTDVFALLLIEAAYAIYFDDVLTSEQEVSLKDRWRRVVAAGL